MINAKKELLQEIEGKAKIKTMYIAYGNNLNDYDGYLEDNTITYGGDVDDCASVFELKEGYTKQEYDNTIKLLDFLYDNGYGLQYLFGFVIFEDGTRLERHEYDGAEHREYKKTPSIENYRIK